MLDEKQLSKHQRRRAQKMRSTGLSALGCVLCLILTPVWAHAQGKLVELTDVQMTLNNQAIGALQADPPDTDAAQRLLSAALVSGPAANILFMTLGRSHQIAGECSEAAKAYSDAAEAPGVKGVPSDQIRARLQTYRSELEASCPGNLLVQCKDPDTELRSEAIASIKCNVTIEVPPGQYTIGATLDDMSTTVQVQVVGTRDTLIEVSLGGDERRVMQSFRRGATGVERGINEADRAQAAEFKRLQDARLQAEEKRLAEERERLAAQQRAIKERGGDPSLFDDKVEGWHGQVAVTAPFGGYLVQARDGSIDGGFLFGGSLNASMGYAFSPLLAIEDYLQFDYTYGYAQSIKYIKGFEERQKIGLRGWRVLNEVRGWLAFASLGMFIDYRSQTLDFYRESHETPTFLAGPSISLSSTAISRADGYAIFTGRWAPLVDGANNVFSVQLQGGVSHFQFSVEYGKLTGQATRRGALMGGEYVTLNLGFRVPFYFE